MARGGWASGRVNATRTATARSRCARCRPIPRASWSRTPRRASCRSPWPSSWPSARAGTHFFLEEAIRDLIERGALRRRNGGWQLAVDVDELAIPAAVQGTLQARLDRLDRQTRETLSWRPSPAAPSAYRLAERPFPATS